MADRNAFWRSLRDHPGLLVGAFWPLMLLGAIASRKDFTGFGSFSVAAWFFLAFVAALPWFLILWTAWAGRHQYAEAAAGCASNDQQEQPR